jgi:hypothetical protein
MRASALLIASVAVALATASLCGCTKRIDQAAAWAVVDKVEIASRDANWAGIKYYVSPDCVIHDTAPKQDGTMETTSKGCSDAVDEEARVLSAAAYQGATHQYSYQIQVVVIEGPKAVAHLSTSETISNRGHSLKTASDQVETLQMRDSKLLITAIDEKVTSLQVDGREIF